MLPKYPSDAIHELRWRQQRCAVRFQARNKAHPVHILPLSSSSVENLHTGSYFFCCRGGRCSYPGKCQAAKVRLTQHLFSTPAAPHNLPNILLGFPITTLLFTFISLSHFTALEILRRDCRLSLGSCRFRAKQKSHVLFSLPPGSRHVHPRCPLSRNPLLPLAGNPALPIVPKVDTTTSLPALHAALATDCDLVPLVYCLATNSTACLALHPRTPKASCALRTRAHFRYPG